MELPHQLILPRVDSSLSPYVKTLLCHDGVTSVKDGHALMSREKLLDFDYIQSILPEQTDVAEYFHKSVKALGPVFTAAEVRLSECTTEQYALQYGHLLRWTGKDRVFLQCFEALKSGTDVDKLTYLLLITATLERCLGDLYLTRGDQCPSMLKDLLVTPQLRDILGSSAIQVLRILIGPPISLNLRNVVWHGFPYPGEIPDRYVWFMMLLVPSIGQLLLTKAVELESIPHREPVLFPQARIYQQLFRDKVDLDVEDLKLMVKFVSNPDRANFTVFQPETVWKTAMQYYISARYGECTALLLCQLEHGLRRVFATCNNCPNRVLTAESTALYTTLDEIFDKFLPDGSENKLIGVIGEEVLEYLFDLLVYPDGPRIRDRLSHGEAEWDTFPLPLTQAVIVVNIYLEYKIIDSGRGQNRPAEVQRICQFISDYESQFHKISQTKQKVCAVCDSAYTMLQGITFDSTLAQLQSAGQQTRDVGGHRKLQEAVNNVCQCLASMWSLPVTCQELCKHFFTPFVDGRDMATEILKAKISTVYRGQNKQTTESTSNTEVEGSGMNKEGEVVGLLLKIVTEWTAVIQQVSCTLQLRQQQLVNKELRSRQRDNLKKLISCCPHYYLGCQVTSLLVCWQLYNLDNLAEVSTNGSHVKKYIRFWKTALQYSENMRTLTGPDKNKWQEALELTDKLVQEINNGLQNGILCSPRR